MRYLLLALLLSVRAASADVPSFGLPEPATPARVEVVEGSPSPTYYRLSPQTTHFLSRSAIGTHTRLTGDRETDFSFDILIGAAVRFDRRSGTALWIEGGYSYVKGREHLAIAGIGVGHRKRGRFEPLFALVPHVIAGSIDGEGCVGLRTSVIAGFAAYAIELAHQVAVVDGTQVHELHAAFTFPFLSGLE
jgi:hypothetical protein